ncbi:hypothetical protein [Chelativorans sp. M5D2P16]|uniref:alpha/beta fold hydrolase n=1 Tax=Chelativorans sp. M5D2P16 TaxID=3095678 RepID=UPI002ACA5B63|nr:hypothetical protein [Chelativorans sp. M5D2P16]MDZ5697343.1 hypothetical protein [Chelativorans sp. M5D2P16]
MDRISNLRASHWECWPHPGLGTGKSLPRFAPSAADDPALQQWWGKFERLGATPGTAIALMRMKSKIVISEILPAIQAPTLVLHRTGDVLIDIEGGRELARYIPGAPLVEYPGDDHLSFVGDDFGEHVVPELSEPWQLFRVVEARSPVSAPLKRR